MKKIISILLLTALLLTSTVVIAEPEIMPQGDISIMSDDFFTSYGISVAKAGSGSFAITFTTTALYTMSILGVSSYDVEQKIDGTWTTVASVLPGAFTANTAAHGSTKGYYGTAGCEYRIYARFYAQKYDNTSKTVGKYSVTIIP